MSYGPFPVPNEPPKVESRKQLLPAATNPRDAINVRRQREVLALKLLQAHPNTNDRITSMDFAKLFEEKSGGKTFVSSAKDLFESKLMHGKNETSATVRDTVMLLRFNCTPSQAVAVRLPPTSRPASANQYQMRKARPSLIERFAQTEALRTSLSERRTALKGLASPSATTLTQLPEQLWQTSSVGGRVRMGPYGRKPGCKPRPVQWTLQTSLSEPALLLPESDAWASWRSGHVRSPAIVASPQRAAPADVQPARNRMESPSLQQQLEPVAESKENQTCPNQMLAAASSPQNIEDPVDALTTVQTQHGAPSQEQEKMGTLAQSRPDEGEPRAVRRARRASVEVLTAGTANQPNATDVDRAADDEVASVTVVGAGGSASSAQRSSPVPPPSLIGILEPTLTDTPSMYSCAHAFDDDAEPAPATAPAEASTHDPSGSSMVTERTAEEAAREASRQFRAKETEALAKGAKIMLRMDMARAFRSWVDAWKETKMRRS